MGLGIKATVQCILTLVVFRATDQHKELRQIQVPFFAGAFKEAHQRQLDLLVTRGRKGGIPVDLKPLFDVIGVAAHAIQEFPFACGLIISHRRLHQVAGAVQLMAFPVIKPFFRLHYGEIYIEVSMLILIVGNEVHYTVHDPLQFRFPLLPRQVSRRLHPLGNIGVPEIMRLIGHALFPVAFECIKPTGFHKAVVHRIDGGLSYHVLLLFPKSA